MLQFPTREQIREKTKGLISGIYSHEEISDWANQWVAQEHEIVTDFATWSLLKKLSGADLISLDRPYLFGKEDFKNWLEEFEQEIQRSK